jgi:hypothetical protein
MNQNWRTLPHHRQSLLQQANNLFDFYQFTSINPKGSFFTGKPDIYHALQACLIPLYPTTVSLTRGIWAPSLS